MVVECVCRVHLYSTCDLCEGGNSGGGGESFDEGMELVARRCRVSTIRDGDGYYPIPVHSCAVRHFLQPTNQYHIDKGHSTSDIIQQQSIPTVARLGTTLSLHSRLQWWSLSIHYCQTTNTSSCMIIYCCSETHCMHAKLLHTIYSVKSVNSVVPEFTVGSSVAV